MEKRKKTTRRGDAEYERARARSEELIRIVRERFAETPLGREIERRVGRSDAR